MKTAGCASTTCFTAPTIPATACARRWSSCSATDMANPVLVEVLRGDLVESRHEGSVAVFDAAGKSVLAIGDVDQPVFPRSAVKAIQALPLVESGAADHYGFG